MSNVIRFPCTHCGSPLRAPVTAGGMPARCPKCKQVSFVPKLDTIPPQTPSELAVPAIDVDVQMNAGSEVLRGLGATPSSSTGKLPLVGGKPASSVRRSLKGTPRIPLGSDIPGGYTPVPPSRPETSRMYAPEGEGAPGGMNPMLIGGVVAGGVLVLAAVIAALVLMSPPTLPINTDSGTNTAKSGDGAKESPEEVRRALTRKLEDTNLGARAAIELFGQARSSLRENELLPYAQKIATTCQRSNGGDMKDEELLAVARDLRDSGFTAEGLSVAEVVVLRNRGTTRDNETPAYLEAQSMLGRRKIDFDDLRRRAEVLADAAVDEAPGLLDALRFLEPKARNSWVSPSDGREVGEIEKQIIAFETILQRENDEDPFMVHARPAFARFKREPMALKRRWVLVTAKPFVLYVQQADRETLEAARTRAQFMRSTVAQIRDFVQREFLSQMRVERTTPDNLVPAERENSPIEIIVALDDPTFAAYNRETRSTPWKDVVSSRTHWCTYQPVRRIGVREFEAGAADDEIVRDLSPRILGCLLDMHDPTPPRGDENDALRSRFQTFLLRDVLWHVWSESTLRPTEGGPVLELFRRVPDYREKLWSFRQPQKKEMMGERAIPPFGGPVLTVEDLLSIEEIGSTHQVARSVRQAVKDNFVRYGWPSEAGIMIDYRSMWLFYRTYAGSFLLFLFNHDVNGKFVYRHGLVRLIEADLKGEVKTDGLKAAFLKAMNLQESDLPRLEKEFLDYQR